VWQLPGIDVVSVHIYTDQDPLQFVPDLSAQYDAAVPDKPLLLEEFGYNTSEESADSNDKTGIHLHNGLWATLFSGLGASGMYWWWDSYIEPLNLWTHFGAITRFLAGIDVAQFKPAPATVTATPGQEVAAEGLLLQGDGKILLWVRNKQYTAAAVDAAHDKTVRDALRNHQVLKDFVYEPPLVNGQSVQLGDVTAGSYDVRWFDPQSGEWQATETIHAEGGALTLPIPAFDRDIAAVITVKQ
jgi:hypothetical protein